MFDVPFISRRRDDNGAGSSGYECIWCDYRAVEKHNECPNCGRPGYAPAGVVSAMMLMGGIIFTLIGVALTYVTFWVVSERLVDDRLARDGTPWGVIFIMVVGCALTLGRYFLDRGKEMANEIDHRSRSRTWQRLVATELWEQLNSRAICPV